MGKKITISKAKKLQKKWWDTRLNVVTNGIKHEDTCQFQYSLEELQNYLDEVKRKSLEQGVDSPGINIWLGAYDETIDKPSLTTVFLTPTKRVNAENTELGYVDISNDEIEPYNGNGGLWPPLAY